MKNVMMKLEYKENLSALKEFFSYNNVKILMIKFVQFLYYKYQQRKIKFFNKNAKIKLIKMKSLNAKFNSQKIEFQN